MISLHSNVLVKILLVTPKCKTIFVISKCPFSNIAITFLLGNNYSLTNTEKKPETNVLNLHMIRCCEVGNWKNLILITTPKVFRILGAPILFSPII